MMITQQLQELPIGYYIFFGIPIVCFHFTFNLKEIILVVTFKQAV